MLTQRLESRVKTLEAENAEEQKSISEMKATIRANQVTIDQLTNDKTVLTNQVQQLLARIDMFQRHLEAYGIPKIKFDS